MILQSIETVNLVMKSFTFLLVSALLLITILYQKRKILKTS